VTEARLRAPRAKEIQRLEAWQPALAELLRRLDGEFAADCEEAPKAIRQGGKSGGNDRLTARRNSFGPFLGQDSRIIFFSLCRCLRSF
jgi:hypothetical protein